MCRSLTGGPAASFPNAFSIIPLSGEIASEIRPTSQKTLLPTKLAAVSYTTNDCHEIFSSKKSPGERPIISQRLQRKRTSSPEYRVKSPHVYQFFQSNLKTIHLGYTSYALRISFFHSAGNNSFADCPFGDSCKGYF